MDVQHFDVFGRRMSDEEAIECPFGDARIFSDDNQSKVFVLHDVPKAVPLLDEDCAWL